MRTVATVFGIISCLLGFFALVLSLVGVKLSYLLFIDSFGPLAGFVIRLSMIVLGMALVALGQTDWQREIEEGEQPI